MRIEKGKHIGKLKTPLAQIVSAASRQSGYQYQLHIVRPHQIDEMLNRDRKPGPPRFIAGDSGQYIVTVYPICDRRYDIEVIGMIYHKQ